MASTADLSANGVIAEVELIEQIEDEMAGRSVAWVCELLVSLGKGSPFDVLDAMWEARYIDFIDGEGAAVPRWRCEEVLRLQEPSVLCNVVSTEQGSEWARGG